MRHANQTTDATRVLLVADAWAQTRTGNLDGSVLLHEVLPAFDGIGERHVVERVVSILYDLADVIDGTVRGLALNAYVRARLHAAARGASSNATNEERLLCSAARSPQRFRRSRRRRRARKEARRRRKITRANDKSVDIDYGQLSVEVAARTADPAALRKEAEAEVTPQAHALAMRAAAGVIDPTRSPCAARLDAHAVGEAPRRSSRSLGRFVSRHRIALTSRSRGRTITGMVFERNCPAHSRAVSSASPDSHAPIKGSRNHVHSTHKKLRRSRGPKDR